MAKLGGTMTAKDAAAALLEANPALHGGTHHASIKKAWSAWRIQTNALRRKGSPTELAGDFLREVRQALGAANQEVAEPGTAPDEVAVTAAATQGRAARAGYDDAAVAKARAEVAEMGDRASDWAKTGATAADGTEGAEGLLPSTCKHCDGDGVKMVARVSESGAEEQVGVYCECPLGARRRVEDKQVEIEQRASGAEPTSSGSDGLVGEETDMAKTKTKMAKRTGRTSATTRAAKKVATGEHDRDAAAALKKKYAKVKEILEWTDKGKPAKVRIRCEKVSSECEKERDVKVQDLFQVHRCPPCQAQFMKNRRAADRAAK